MGVIYLKAMHGHKLGMEKRYHMSMEGIRKGYLFCPKLYMWYYTRQPFYIYRRDIFHLKSGKIFRRAPMISEDVRRRSEDFRRRYEEFRLTRTQERKGTLTSL